MSNVRPCVAAFILIAAGLAIFFSGYFLGQGSVHYEQQPSITRYYFPSGTPTPAIPSGRTKQDLRQ